MRRASIGTVELTSAACTPAWDRAPGSFTPEPGVGLTTGNKSDGLIADTPEPGIGGSAISGGIEVELVEDGTTVALLAAAASTTSVAEAENAVAPLAEAFAVNATRPPVGAELDTATDTSSSYTWPSGRLEILHVAPLADGQMA